MKHKILWLVGSLFRGLGLLLLFSFSVSHAQIITTIAGNGLSAYSGDGGPATNAGFTSVGVAIDAIGNVYIADQNHRIRKVDTSGIISTIAGSLGSGYSGDGGPATAALFDAPWGIFLDSSGNMFITDYQGDMVRKINNADTISTIAGNGSNGYTGDNGPATLAQLANPVAVAADGTGNVYVADPDNNVIRKVTTSGIITTFVGTIAGFSGDGGPASAAQLFEPRDMAIDRVGNMYIADGYNHRIRKVNTAGIITTVAGNGIGAGTGFGSYT